MRIVAPLLLVVYAIVVAAVGTRWLARASWPLRMPRLGIAVWQVLTVTFVASALVAGLIIAVPCLPKSVSWDAVAELRNHYDSAGRVAASIIAALVTLAAAGRLIWATASALAIARRRRARHDEALALVGRRGPFPGVVLLEDERPAVYCLPGRRRIVFTTGALRRLDRQQIQAVLAHERAHLAGRHHLVIMLARVLPGAFPGIPFLAVAASQIGSLVEMAADDAAARRAHRLTLAGALLTLAEVRVPAAALGAALGPGETAGAQRIRRLIETPRPASRARRAAGFILTMVAAPAVALAVPALALTVITDCVS